MQKRYPAKREKVTVALFQGVDRSRNHKSVADKLACFVFNELDETDVEQGNVLRRKVRHLIFVYRNVFIQVCIAFVCHFENLINIRLELTFARQLDNFEMIKISCVLCNSCNSRVYDLRSRYLIFSPYGVFNEAERTEMIDVIRVGIKRCKHILAVETVCKQAFLVLIAVSERTADLLHTVFFAEFFNSADQRLCDLYIVYHIDSVEAYTLLTVFSVCKMADYCAYPADRLAVLICHHQFEVTI